MGVDRAAIVTLTCRVLHNFCEIHSEDVLLPANVEHYRDLYVSLRRVP
jgi:hypothetical protein